MATMTDRSVLSRETVERVRVRVEDEPEFWRLVATDAREAVRLRHAFRDYLESYGDPTTSDFDAAEAVYGELVANCVAHAPGSIRVEFRWDDGTLAVVDASDRLRDWPFSANDTAAEITHHSYAIVNALTGRVRLARDGGGTRATVELPVRAPRPRTAAR